MAGSCHSFQMFDSMAVDSAGHVCVATLMNGGISVVPPEGGAIDFIAMAGRHDDQYLFRRAGIDDGLHHAFAHRQAGCDGVAPARREG